MTNARFIAVFGLISLQLIFIIHTNAKEWNVPGDCSTIQTAINAAGKGDLITVEPGTYYENIDFRGKAITLTSIDPNDFDIVASTIIDGNQIASVVTFKDSEDPNTVLSGFTLSHGSGNAGGGIYCFDVSPTIKNCLVIENKANLGGGIYCEESSPFIFHCTFIKNTDYSALYFYKWASPHITKCLFFENNGVIVCDESSSPNFITTVKTLPSGQGQSSEAKPTEQ